MGCSSGPDIIQDGLVLCLDAASKRSYVGSGTTWTDIAANRSAIMTNGISYSDTNACLLYTSPSPRDVEESRMPSSA